MSGLHGSPYEKRPHLGDVYLVQFSDGVGCEQSGVRPCVVFQNNMGNWFSPNLIVLPLTSAIKKMDQPTHVFISADGNGLRYDSTVLCESPQCISKNRIIGHKLTTLSKETMKKIAVAHMVATGSIDLLGLYDAVKCNAANS